MAVPRAMMLWMAALLGGSAPLSAFADPGDVAAAEALFRSGKELLAHQEYASACPKLAESYRLDPATGTLLSLAICHERAGKLASAWGEYAEVASRAKAESRPDRESAARSRVAELEPKVSSLTVRASDGIGSTPGLEIRRNGVPISAAWLGTPIPVDGGLQTIDATAPGKRSFHAEVTLAPSGDQALLTIPPLQDSLAPRADLRNDSTPTPLPPSAAPTGTAPSSAAPPALVAPIESGHGGLSPVQTTGLVVGLVGIASLGVGAYFGVHAISLKNGAAGQCDASNRCSPSGEQDLSDAVAAGNISSVTVIGGGALVALGAAMLWLGRHSSETTAQLRYPVQALPLADIHAVGGMLRGNF